MQAHFKDQLGDRLIRDALLRKGRPFEAKVLCPVREVGVCVDGWGGGGWRGLGVVRETVGAHIDNWWQ